MLKKQLLVSFISSICMSLFYIMTEFSYKDITLSFSTIYIVGFITIIFLVFFIVIAIPVQTFIYKKLTGKRLKLKALLIYLFVAFLFHFSIYKFFNSNTLFFENNEVFLYIFATSITFWFWESILIKNVL